jgi:putative transcriptional regulator
MTIDKSISEQLSPGSLVDHFLIAMPGLQDPNFANALIYIFDHSVEGAMGFIINKSTDIPLSTIFQQLNLKRTKNFSNQIIVFGGPIAVHQGFVLHCTVKQRWEHTLKISSQVSLTSSLDILQDMASGDGPDETLVVLGYASWEQGQLEEEVANNSWLTAPASASIIFHTEIDKKVTAAASHIGVDLRLLSNIIGHA